MKYLIALLTFVISISAFAQSEKYGRDLTLKEKTEISKILSAPEEFVGKTVLVEGEVLDVCQMAGCWMELKSDAKDQKIKIKVKDGDIVFPVEAKGKNAVVEGTVYKIELTKEEAVEYYEHVAAEQGTEFDPATVTGPVTFYQIKGLGAEIK
jgi:hypothetical protein